MLSLSVGIYLFISIAIGLIASFRVRNTSDFVLAGRKLPLLLSGSVIFATWFGSETILGASSAFIEDGLLGVIEEPFGAFLCLFLVGVLFAKKIYKLNVLTISDLFRNRFGNFFELPSSILMVITFFGWIAGQFVALGVVVHSITGMDFYLAMTICSGLVMLYTITGGMWAVAFSDLIQSVLIVVGILLAFFFLNTDVKPVTELIAAAPENQFRFFPETGLNNWLEYIAAWITLGLGAIPSQDIFQRVLSAKDEKTAFNSTLLGAFLYLILAIFPLLLALYAKDLLPADTFTDTQLMLPHLVINYLPLWIQIVFFGALISAILSTSSGALLAPATIFAENIYKHYQSEISDKTLLAVLRWSVLGIGLFSLLMGFYQGNIYELVAGASSLTLVCFFVPLVVALWFPKINGKAAFVSMISGLLFWIVFEFMNPIIPTSIGGLAGSALGLFLAEYVLRMKQASSKLNY
ncbi:sodium:solute symporter [bacterium]|nr:MAG: sodium:solute symporter [bacterium]